MYFFTINKYNFSTILQSQKEIYGVNISGAEFGENNLPGVIKTNYIYPQDLETYNYFSSKRITLIRLPIRWERVQNHAYGNLSSPDIMQIQNVLKIAEKNHMQVIIDLHNFGRYYGSPLTKETSNMLSDVWTKLALQFRNFPGLYGYELMNEPHDLPGGSNSWAKIAQDVTLAIRIVDHKSAILIPGYNWQNAQNWSTNNSHILISDPYKNVIYSSHIYFDSTYQGIYKKDFDSDNRTINDGVNYSNNFRDWLLKHHARGMFTEFGVPDNDPRWLTTMDLFLQANTSNPNIVGSIYWSSGPWWNNYPLSIQPKNGQDRPQMKILQKYSI